MDTNGETGVNWTETRDYESMSRLAGERLAGVIGRALAERGAARIGLATGNTMIGVYQDLAERLNRAGQDLSGLTTFNLDEYVDEAGRNVPDDHPLSYRKYMREKLFALVDRRLGFRMENMRFPDATDPGRYDAEIREGGGLDFQLLGIGFNGHIAFNEPMAEDRISTAAFSALPSRVIELDALTIRTNANLTAGGDGGLVPRKAVTMGMRSILEAREILLLACFEEQARPLAEMKKGRVTPALPASYLLTHPRAGVVFTAETIRF